MNGERNAFFLTHITPPFHGLFRTYWDITKNTHVDIKHFEPFREMGRYHRN